MCCGEFAYRRAGFGGAGPGGDGRVASLGVADGFGLGGAHGRVGLARVAAAQFGVSRDGEAATVFGRVVPGLTVFHDACQDSLTPGVGGGHGGVARGERVMRGCQFVVAAATGGSGLGLSAHDSQVGVAGGEPDLPELVTGPRGRPRSVSRISGAKVQQLAIGHGTDLGIACQPERGICLIPGSALFGTVTGRFRANRLSRMLVPVQLAVCTNGTGPVLPVQPGKGVIGHVSEGGDSPGGLVLDDVLADPFLALGHRARDADDMGMPLRVGEVRRLRCPGPSLPGDKAAGALADAGVDDGGDVPGIGQAARGHGIVEDLGRVQAGEFRGVQGPPQPLGLGPEVVGVAGQDFGQEIAVMLVAGGGGLGSPDGMQDGQVIGVGQVLPQGGGGGSFLAVPS